MLSEENSLRAILLAAMVIGFVLGVFFYYNAWSMNLVPAKECYLYRSDRPDFKVYGNCYTLQNITNIMTPNPIKTIDWEEMEKDDRNLTTLGTMATTMGWTTLHTTTTLCRPTSQCPICQCPQAPQCPKSSIDLEDIRTARPDCENSICQQGYFRMKKRCLVAVGFTAPKFNEGPPIDATPPGEIRDLNEKVCFNWDLRGYSFNMNISSWHMENRTVYNTTMYHFSVISRENGS